MEGREHVSMCCTFSLQVLPESQPLTPISTSTPDHGDARTPQSVRSLDSEPPSSLVIPPVVNVTPTPVKANQRKRKIDRGSINQGSNHSSRNHNAATPVGGDGNITPLGLPMEAPSTNQPSPCAKRQIIVQNEVMDGSHPHGNHAGPVTPASVNHESAASPHHSSSIEADNSGDSARWRKVSHQSHWESAVSTGLSALKLQFP